MKKLSLIITLLLAVLLLQKCRKDSYTETATSTNTLFALINDTTWNADTITAALNYNSATNSKVFTCTGIADNKKVNMLITMPNAINTAGIPLSMFNSNASGSIAFSYFTSSTTAGVTTFHQQGTVGPGFGTITFTAVDSVAKKVTGIFTFTSEIDNYDSNGNLILTINEVEAGAFNKLPYTFTSN